MATETVRLNVCVTPRSGRDEVVGLVEGPQGTEVRLRVRAVPEKGKANEAVCKLLASALGIPKSAVSVVSGSASHHKAVQIEAENGVVAAWLSMLE